jgi:hypothetical protein
MREIVGGGTEETHLHWEYHITEIAIEFSLERLEIPWPDA